MPELTDSQRREWLTTSANDLLRFDTTPVDPGAQPISSASTDEEKFLEDAQHRLDQARRF